MKTAATTHSDLPTTAAMREAVKSSELLSDGDPAAVEIVDASAPSNILLVCEHAGQAVPKSLGRLGLTEQDFHSHIGWDIGAEALARKMAARLDAPLVIQRYSRLVIDCNRPPDTEGSIPHLTGGIHVPGNLGLTRAEREARWHEIFDPYDKALNAAFSSNDVKYVFSVHSFTSVFPGQDRPWDAGFLTRKDETTAQSLIHNLQTVDPDLTLALNEPYQIEDESDWLIPRYAEARHLRHSLIEVRNSHIVEEAGQDHWAALLSKAIQTTTKAQA